MREGRPLSFYVLAAVFALFVLFLYGPTLTIFVLSFQGPQGGLTFPMNGVSTFWFEKLWAGMDLFDNLLLGLTTALQWQNLLYCLFGVLIGTAIGVLPGIGPIPTVALLLPFTFGLDPSSAFIMQDRLLPAEIRGSPRCQ